MPKSETTSGSSSKGNGHKRLPYRRTKTTGEDTQNDRVTTDGSVQNPHAGFTKGDDVQVIATRNSLSTRNACVRNSSAQYLRMSNDRNLQERLEHDQPTPRTVDRDSSEDYDTTAQDNGPTTQDVWTGNTNTQNIHVGCGRLAQNSGRRSIHDASEHGRPRFSTAHGLSSIPVGSSSRGQGFFSNASHLLVQGNQMINNNVQNVLTRDIRVIMKDLAEHSIPGVEHDSSERDPPPQCHPGTRLDICGQAQTWFHDPKRKAKILWIHGPAGVGKSAIMQTLAQEDVSSPTSILGATVFFSKLRERNDPKKLFNTVAYQLATRYKSYRRYVTDILTKDPKAVEKSMQEQFRRFIVVPFAEQHLFQGTHLPVLIILDGLDEVEGEEPQRALVSLITHFSLKYPGTPLVWVITSRPEPHIMNAFSHSEIRSSYWTIEIVIDSDKGRADVEKFLRDRFEEVRSRYASMLRSNTLWPSEVDFLKVADASSGHFVFAEVVSRFIIDETYGNPVSQLKVVIAAIEALPSTILRSNPLASLDNLYERILSTIPSIIQPNPVSQLKVVIAAIEALPSAILRFNPLASLDNLYERILSTIPSIIQPITMHLLALSFAEETSDFNRFWLICNWLKLSQADAYGALRKLHSFLRIPPPEEVDYDTRLEPFHKSFSDYILSPTRSGQYQKLSQADAYGALRKLHSVLRIPPPEKVDYDTRLEPFHKSFSDYILSPTRSGQYHIPDALKSALVGAVRALYESHNSFEFTVQSSQIKVSWAYEDDIVHLQSNIFYSSLVAVVEHIDDAINCEDDAAHTNGRLAAFFRDIDYADFSNLWTDRTVGNLFRIESRAGMFPVLEDWGLARPITISSIHLNHVRADQTGDVDGYPAEREPTAIPHFFTDYKYPWGKAPFSQYLSWQGRLQEHLQAVVELELPARVYLIGKGSKSVVAIYQNIDAALEWCYIIPYDQS
ncbi:hypothetical protein AN958_01379 [Leucoagaricus sp. SymC.cos]|nr:hypothetical protein AN958_01379 [Leucoagaricus sp. SymC.cos]